jgi:type III pantothenate kinase
MPVAAEPSACWLLVGNSRWHWARLSADGLQVTHQDPERACLALAAERPVAWAAVGRLPPAAALDPGRRVSIEAVPLETMPTWLGVDRALAGWQAWRQRRRTVLVADAGTALSLTLVDRGGRFIGGRLLAGCGLQLRALEAGTAGLRAPVLLEGGGLTGLGEAWPRQTADAMAVGVVLGLAAAVAAALREALDQHGDCSLVLTGGDGELLRPWLVRQLEGSGAGIDLSADLALRALVELRPAASWSGP